MDKGVSVALPESERAADPGFVRDMVAGNAEGSVAVFACERDSWGRPVRNPTIPTGWFTLTMLEQTRDAHRMPGVAKAFASLFKERHNRMKASLWEREREKIAREKTNDALGALVRAQY